MDKLAQNASFLVRRQERLPILSPEVRDLALDLGSLLHIGQLGRQLVGKTPAGRGSLRQIPSLKLLQSGEEVRPVELGANTASDLRDEFPIDRRDAEHPYLASAVLHQINRLAWPEDTGDDRPGVLPNAGRN